MNPTSASELFHDGGNGASPSGAAINMVDAVRGNLSKAAIAASETTKQCGTHFVTEPAQDMFGLLKTYAKSNPDVVAMWCFGFGVVVGWKIRR